MAFADNMRQAAKKVQNAINMVADRVADAIETAGNRAQEAASRLGAVGGWAGAVTSGVCDLAGMAVKGLGSTIAGPVSGVILFAGGMFKRGLIDMVSGPTGGVLLFAGKFVSLIQIVFAAERRKRRLTEKEVAMLKLVFRTSVALYNIRVIEGKCGVYGFNNRAFTMGNTIYMKNTGTARWDQTLVHETTHVWQYQHAGSAYSSDALGAQLYYEHVQKASAYDWPNPKVNQGNMAWENWNREAQAQFIEDAYANGALQSAGGRFTYRTTDYTALADATLLLLRKEHSRRGSLDRM